MEKNNTTKFVSIGIIGVLALGFLLGVSGVGNSDGATGNFLWWGDDDNDMEDDFSDDIESECDDNVCTLYEGASVSYEGKSISINFISGNSVKLNVDGEITFTLSKGESQRMEDNLLISIKDVFTQDYSGGVKYVIFEVTELEEEYPEICDVGEDCKVMKGEEQRIANGKLVRIAFIDNNEVTFYVSGESTGKLQKYERGFLSNGDSIYVLDIFTQDYVGGMNYAIFEYHGKDSEGYRVVLTGSSDTTCSEICDTDGAREGLGKSCFIGMAHMMIYKNSISEFPLLSFDGLVTCNENIANHFAEAIVEYKSKGYKLDVDSECLCY